MRKLAILMTLVLAMSTAALANPIFEARGAEASNALYQERSSAACPDEVSEDVCIKPIRLELVVQTWVDPDSDGDGILTLESTETLSSNRGQVTAAVTSPEKKPKFKAGAELSKISSMHVGDLDGDGYGDIALSIRQEELNNKNSYRVTATSLEDWRLPARVEPMNKAELIEAMASESGLSKADAKRCLEDVTGEIILGEDR
ncbi:HU family DNA-binding protein [Candidatus Nanosalina sp. VS9-1]|uniref:HU family DNA-binding protein n=1 Tax=Candidatus Nanosalina sp. VS9-1 TaxID=3388566 RepID=UPI0039E01DFC